jgi:predicted RNase H-like nuclease (RuvC/YqgF family)
VNTVLVGVLVPLIAAIISGSGIGLWTYRTTNRRHAITETEARKHRQGGMNGYTTVIRDAANRIEELRAEVEALREERSQLTARLAECEQRRTRPGSRPRKST